MGAGILCFLSKSLSEGITFPRLSPPRLWCHDWEGSTLRQQRLYLLPVRLAVGDHVWLGDDVGIQNLAQVTIESNVCVSRRCYLSTGSHDFRREDFKLEVAPILIRQGSWIAIGSLVVAGVTIGDGAVVSAGSVVLRDVPANCLVRGNPAQLVCEIFRDPGGAKAAIGVSRPHFSEQSISPPTATVHARDH